LSATRLWHGQQAQRLRAELPTFRKHPYLEAHASVLEAEAQVRRWQRFLHERSRQLAQLQQPQLDVEVHLLEPGSALPFEQERTHAAIVSTDGSLAVALFGRELSG
jgi:hypothetical protein